MHKKIVFFIILLQISTLESRIISYKIIPEFVKKYPATKWIKCTENYAFSYPEFPLYPEYNKKRFPNQGVHSDSSIVEVCNGQTLIHPQGFIFINDTFLEETKIKGHPFERTDFINSPEASVIFKIKGRVAVINHLYSWVYGLFILDILTSLALLEIYGIEYDYVCIPYNRPFIREAFEIWGLDTTKIIPLEVGMSIQADTIILPTSVSQNPEVLTNVNTYPDFLLKYVREKMLSGVQKMNIQMDFPEKIFISRKDASHSRKIPNEDEVFALFEPLGYKRFEFSNFSMAEKIAITHHAKSIVSFLGSGNTNILFANSDIKFYEIQQEWVEATFYFIAKTLGFHYEILNASTMNDLLYGMPWSKGRTLPLYLVKKFIENHPDL